MWKDEQETLLLSTATFPWYMLLSSALRRSTLDNDRRAQQKSCCKNAKCRYQVESTERYGSLWLLKCREYAPCPTALTQGLTASQAGTDEQSSRNQVVGSGWGSLLFLRRMNWFSKLNCSRTYTESLGAGWHRCTPESKPAVRFDLSSDDSGVYREPSIRDAIQIQRRQSKAARHSSILGPFLFFCTSSVAGRRAVRGTQTQAHRARQAAFGWRNAPKSPEICSPLRRSSALRARILRRFYVVKGACTKRPTTRPNRARKARARF